MSLVQRFFYHLHHAAFLQFPSKRQQFSIGNVEVYNFMAKILDADTFAFGLYNHLRGQTWLPHKFMQIGGEVSDRD